MTTSTDLFNSAELSLASYADFPVISSQVLTSAYRNKLTAAGMAEKQAVEFADRYPYIVCSIPNTATGFSATVFM